MKTGEKKKVTSKRRRQAAKKAPRRKESVRVATLHRKPHRDGPLETILMRCESLWEMMPPWLREVLRFMAELLMVLVRWLRQALHRLSPPPQRRAVSIPIG